MNSFLEIAKPCNLSKYSVAFSQWQSVAKNLPELIAKDELRKIVSELPELNLDEIRGDIGAIQLIYTIATFLAHGYIRGRPGDVPIKRLPWIISSVWIETGRLLGIPPVATYAATVLFNFEPERSLQTVEDIEIMFSFTGSEDEKWFYAISAAVDVKSRNILRIAEDFTSSNSCDLDEIGKELAREIEEITIVLNRMYERCRPEVFYGQVRGYLRGWFNDPEFQEDDGLIYELTRDGRETTTFNLAGGSAAQNPTIQLLDILLGVKHAEGSEDNMMLKSNGCLMDYLSAMRTYMPREHSTYLDNLEAALSQSGRLEMFKLTEGYVKCIEALTKFRTEHIKMVSRYITCQSRKCKNEEILGTGGSNPIQFLKKCRRDTEKLNKNSH